MRASSLKESSLKGSLSDNRNPTGHTKQHCGFDGGPYPNPQAGLSAKCAAEKERKQTSRANQQRGDISQISSFVSQTEEQESRIENLEGAVNILNIEKATLKQQVRELLEWMKAEKEKALTLGKGKGKGSKTGKGKGQGKGKQGPSTLPTTKKKQNNSNGSSSSSTTGYANHSCWVDGGDGYGYWNYGDDADYQQDHY